MQGAVDIKPDFVERRVINFGAVGGKDQSVVCVYVFIDLNACSVPNILVAAQKCTQLFQKLPVVIVVEFEAMTGEHKQSWIAAGAVHFVRIQSHKVLNVFLDLGVVMA